MTVWKQYRRVEIGDSVEITSDLDSKIRVRRPKDESLQFDVTVWNLAASTWARIEKGDPVTVELGWVEGPRRRVTFGTVESLDRRHAGNDLEFTIKGTDASSKRVRLRTEGRWRDREPQAIAADLADEVGLTPVTDGVGQPIRGTWSAEPNKRISAWLDELLDYAAAFTGVQWEWYAESGRLYFVRRQRETVEAPTLRYGENLLSLSRKSSTDEDADREFGFELQLDPRIKTREVLFAETELFRGSLRVVDYEYVSDTISGDHVVKGTAVPTETKFPTSRSIEEASEAFASFLEAFSS